MRLQGDTIPSLGSIASANPVEQHTVTERKETVGKMKLVVDSTMLNLKTKKINNSLPQRMDFSGAWLSCSVYLLEVHSTALLSVVFTPKSVELVQCICLFRTNGLLEMGHLQRLPVHVLRVLNCSSSAPRRSVALQQSFLEHLAFAPAVQRGAQVAPL